MAEMSLYNDVHMNYFRQARYVKDYVKLGMALIKVIISYIYNLKGRNLKKKYIFFVAKKSQLLLFIFIYGTFLSYFSDVSNRAKVCRSRIQF